LEGDDQEFELLPHTSAIFVSEWPISLISLLDLDRLCSTRQTSTFTPLIFSGIFYASNGRYKISYIDSLFNCVSAMTVCGLATINLSSLTGFQQALLFFLMCIGNPVSRAVWMSRADDERLEHAGHRIMGHRIHAEVCSIHHHHQTSIYNSLTSASDTFSQGNLKTC
jgi:hypothetical protein